MYPVIDGASVPVAVPVMPANANVFDTAKRHVGFCFVEATIKAVAIFDEKRHINIFDDDVADGDVAHAAAIDAFKGNAGDRWPRLVTGTGADGAVGDADEGKTTDRFGAKFNAMTTRTKVAIGHRNMAAPTRSGAFEHQGVIVAVDITITDPDVFAAIDIEAVIGEIAVVPNVDAIN